MKSACVIKLALLSVLLISCCSQVQGAFKAPNDLPDAGPRAGNQNVVQKRSPLKPYAADNGEDRPGVTVRA